MSGPGLSILIVEDNALNLQLVHDLLTHLGHTLLQARDVNEARGVLAEATPELILLDIQIPGGGGELLLREIRDQRAFDHVVVVALTAFAMHGDRERLLALGFDGYLSKPIDTRAFGSQIAELSGTRKKT